MKNNHKIILSILTFGLIFATPFLSNQNINLNKVEARVGNYQTDVNTYYDDVSNLTGEDLLLGLHDLMYETHKTYTSYDDSGVNEYQRYTDPYPNKSGYIIDFYTHRAINVTWDKGATYNREHVWAQSLTGYTTSGDDNLYGESYGGADMHHIRPVLSGLNSSRSNKLYGEVNGGSTWGGYIDGDLIAYSSGNTFEPHDEVKGDVARIVLYMYMHYNTRSYLGGSSASYNESGANASKPLIITNIIDEPTADEAFDLLVEWNNLDPVDSIETTRNEQVAIYQGNRNPFIDHPEYIDYIWGDGQIIDEDPIDMEINVDSCQLEFSLNSSFNYDGLKVYYVYENGKRIATDDYNVVAPNMTSLGTKEVVINSLSYDFSCSYNIEVVDKVITKSVFEKVTSLDDYSGTYLIVNESLSYAFNSGLSKLDVVNNYINVDINDETIEYNSNLDNSVFTITSYNDGYSICSSLGQYIYQSSNSNGLLTSSTLSSSVTNMIEYVNGNVEIISKASQTHLRFNGDSGQMRFRYYKSGSYSNQEPIALYRLVKQNSDLDMAISFAKDFNNQISNICDYDGNTNLDELTNAWNSLSTKFLNLSSEAQKYFKEGSDNNDILTAIEKYDYIVGKYNLNNFMNRTIMNSTPNLILINDNHFIIILSISLFALALTITFVIIIVKRRKLNHH